MTEFPGQGQKTLMDNSRKEFVEYRGFFENNRAVSIIGQIIDLLYPG